MRALSLTMDLEQRGPFDPASMTVREARRIADGFYREVGGRKSAPARFLTKTGKLEHSDGVDIVGLQLRPGDAAGVEVCNWRTPGCTAACVLETSFRGKSDGVRDGRSMRTLFLQAEPQAMITIIADELRRLAARNGVVYFRPNIASDLRFERFAPALFTMDGVRAYDYTKANPLRHRDIVANYRLVFSVSERAASEDVAVEYMRAGGTAAVVFDCPKHQLPATWRGFEVIDGDITDDRTADPRGVVVGLAAKADGKGDATGFVKPAVNS